MLFSVFLLVAMPTLVLGSCSDHTSESSCVLAQQCYVWNGQLRCIYDHCGWCNDAWQLGCVNQWCPNSTEPHMNCTDFRIESRAKLDCPSEEELRNRMILLWIIIGLLCGLCLFCIAWVCVIPTCRQWCNGYKSITPGSVQASNYQAAATTTEIV